MPQMCSADSSRATDRIVLGLVVKISPNGTICKNPDGVSLVPHRQSGPELPAIGGSGSRAAHAPPAADRRPVVFDFDAAHMPRLKLGGGVPH